MRFRVYKTAACVVCSFFCFVPATFTGQHKQEQNQTNKRPQEKTVWNYDGGVFFETDGTLPNGVCFRISGRMTAQDFFDNLKRVDTVAGAIFRRGTQTVTQFPESVAIAYTIRDQLCPDGMRQIGTRHYLTQEMMDGLRFSIYWKHGVQLRPVKNIQVRSVRVDRIRPYAASLAEELPRRYEWSYELVVPSAGVSLSDGLAFVFRTPDGRIAARVAARL
jgi:hypothetical protein